MYLASQTEAVESVADEPPAKRLRVEEDVEEPELPIPGEYVEVAEAPIFMEEEEPQPGPSSFGLNPTEWGELLGVIGGDEFTSPSVLYCFETLEESDAEEDAA